MTTRKQKYGLQELERDFGSLTFGNLLKAHREGEELAQVEMAKILGISKQSLCDLEKGRKIPSAGRASEIAKKLKMHPESFIRLAIQDQLRQENLYFEVSLEKTRKKAS